MSSVDTSESKAKAHSCSVCDYRGRRTKLVVLELDELDPKTIARAKALGKKMNMSLEKVIRHALHDAMERDMTQEENTL